MSNSTNSVKRKHSAKKRLCAAVATYGEDVERNPNTEITEMRTRAARARMGLKIAGALLIIAGLLGGAHVVVQTLVYRNPQFRLKTIQFLTDGRLTYEELKREAGLSKNVEIADIDLAKVRDNLLNLTSIESVSTERVLPDTLKVTINERKPVAWLQCARLDLKAHSAESGYLIDAKGVPMKCETLYRDYLSLPVIEADEIRGFSERVPITEGPIVSALELLNKNAAEFYEEQFEIKAIKVMNDWSMVAVYGNQAQVTFGRYHLARELKSLHAIVSAALKNGWIISEVNVMPEENIPVKFIQTGAVVSEGRSIPTEENHVKTTKTEKNSPESPQTPPPTIAPPEIKSASPAGRSVETDVRAILGGLYQQP